MRTSKEYLFFYIKENILVFDVFDYLEEISADFVDYAHDWNLIKDGKIKCKDTVVKYHIENNVVHALSFLEQRMKSFGSKVVCFYRENPQYNHWADYFDKPEKMVKLVKRILKSELPNFIEIDSPNPLFQDVKGYFEGFPCIIPTGEDEEFFNKIKKKMKTPIDKFLSVGKIGCHPF